MSAGADPAPEAKGAVPVLEVTGLKKHFPIKKGLLSRTVGQVYAVDGVSFSIRKGETLGLVGESGCGKTTVGRTVLRLIGPTEGTIKINGDDITDLSRKELRRYRREMQIIFQDPFSSLNPRMSAGDIVGEMLLTHGLGNAKERKERVASLFERVGLRQAHMTSFPHEFSGGYLHAFSGGRDARNGIGKWIEFYNNRRPPLLPAMYPPRRRTAPYCTEIETSSPTPRPSFSAALPRLTATSTSPDAFSYQKTCPGGTSEKTRAKRTAVPPAAKTADRSTDAARMPVKALPKRSIWITVKLSSGQSAPGRAGSPFQSNAVCAGTSFRANRAATGANRSRP